MLKIVFYINCLRVYLYGIKLNFVNLNNIKSMFLESLFGY